jgi:hypothetical protein
MRLGVGGAADDAMPVASSTAAAPLVVGVREDVRDDGDLVGLDVGAVTAETAALVGVSAGAVVEVVWRTALAGALAARAEAAPWPSSVAMPMPANTAFEAMQAARTRRVRSVALIGRCSTRRA